MGDVIEILTTATNTVEVEAQGTQGIPGVGVPTGGSALQVLRKKTGTDYDTEWAAAGSGSGSVTSVALASTDLTISGSPITDSGTITANIAANAVTLEKLQTISSEHLLGRHGSGNGGVQQIGLGTGLEMSGSNVGVTFGSSAGTACEGNDARLSDARTPSSTLAHASSHASAGSDPLFDQDLDTTDSPSFLGLTLGGGDVALNNSGGTFKIAGFGNEIDIEGGVISGFALQGNDFGTAIFNIADSTKVAKFDASGITTGTTREFEFPDASGVLALTADIPSTFAASAITSGTLAHERGGLEADVSAYNGLLKISGGSTSAVGIGTGSTEVAAGDHVHGNLTSDGKIGSTSGLPVVTTTAGAVTTLALGTAGQVLTVNSGANGVEFAAASGGGVTGAASSASDVLGVSGANITGVDANADKIVFWDDSASALKYLEVSTGLSLSGTTLTATASGGSKTYAVFTAEHNQPPSTAFATLDTRNSIAVLDFDAATDENAVFVGIMPESASLGSGLIVRLHWMATTATSGNVRWGVQFERSNTDLDSDSFAAAVEANGAANGTSGILTTTAITVTDFDGITAGDVFRLKVFRNADDATNDTMTGDAELVAVEVRSAA